MILHGQALWNPLVTVWYESFSVLHWGLGSLTAQLWSLAFQFKMERLRLLALEMSVSIPGVLGWPSHLKSTRLQLALGSPRERQLWLQDQNLTTKPAVKWREIDFCCPSQGPRTYITRSTLYLEKFSSSPKVVICNTRPLFIDNLLPWSWLGSCKYKYKQHFCVYTLLSAVTVMPLAVMKVVSMPQP